VTRYCSYPVEATEIPKVGGYFDLNYEALVDLEPTLIIMLEEHVKAREYFHETGYKVLVVNHRTVEEIIESIGLIGRAVGAASKADELTSSIRDQMEQIEAQVKGRPHKRVMIAVDRSSPGSLDQIYIAGNDGFFSKMIALAGGINVYEGSIAFPAISAEGILQMNPEVIVELVPETRLRNSGTEGLISDWRTLAGVDAVRNNRVFLLTNDYASIPGPRFILTLRDIANLLHSDES
jgi:iron complex transport system substrate-binding protein